LTTKVLANSLSVEDYRRDDLHTDAGTMLVEHALISEEQLQIALGDVVQFGGTVVLNVIRLGFVSDTGVAAFLAQKLKLPMAEAEQFEDLPAFITKLVPKDIVEVHHLVPIMLQDGMLMVAMVDPTDRAALEAIAFATGYRVGAVVASHGLIEVGMARYYGLSVDEQEVSAMSSAATPAQTSEPAPVQVQTTGSSLFSSLPPEFLPEVAQESVPEPAPEPKKEKGSLEIVRESTGDLDELFFGMGSKDEGIVHLTQKKNPEQSEDSAAGTIADALMSQAETTAPEPRPPEVQTAPTPVPEPDELSSLDDILAAKAAIESAKERDEVAKVLVRFALSLLPRAALFFVKKEILVGWLGGGEGIAGSQIKSVMIPLGSPSVFRTVRETGSNYYGPMPRNTVNDIFVNALGGERPEKVLAVPISIRGKAICIFYGDSGSKIRFEKDLSLLHVLIGEAGKTLERLVLQRKMSRRVIRT